MHARANPDTWPPGRAMKTGMSATGSAGWCRARRVRPAFGQDILEMAFPTRRVLARAEAAGLRPIKHRFDAAAHTGRGLWFHFPDRPQAP